MPLVPTGWKDLDVLSLNFFRDIKNVDRLQWASVALPLPLHRLTASVTLEETRATYRSVAFQSKGADLLALVAWEFGTNLS